MKTISAMEMRKHMGEYLDTVRLKSETLIIERMGRAVAKLSPAENSEKNIKGEIEKKLSILNQMKSISADFPRSENPDEWLLKERSGWERGK